MIELVYLEDDKDQAERTLKHLGVDLIIDNVVLYQHPNQFYKQFKPDEEKVSIYLLDMNFNQQNIGLELLKFINENDPQALTIVYSAYSYRIESLSTGATSFVQKNAAALHADYLEIKNIMELFVEAKGWKKRTVIEGIVNDFVDDKFVSVTCSVGHDHKHKINRLYPITPFLGIKNMDVDSPIKITIHERPGSIFTKFERGEPRPIEITDSETRRSFYDSPIFKP